MRTFVLIPCVLVLISRLGSLAQDDGGCKSTGQKPYDYKQALCMSFLFYEAQRSGALPDDQRVTWRGDAALNDGSDVGEDLAGGYFDGCDFVKYGYPLSFTTTSLSWGLLTYPDGYAEAGQTNYARTAIKRATDFMLKAYKNYEFYGQVGNPEVDQQSWGRPEDMLPSPRPSYKINAHAPGTELAGETSAALASSYLVFKDVEPSYSNLLLELAGVMFEFADMFRGMYTISIPKAYYYSSYDYYGDELCWAALWMYKATNDQKYMTRALAFIDEFHLMENRDMLFYYDDKKPGILALLAELTNEQKYINQLDEYVLHTINDMQHTPKGLLYPNNKYPLSLAAGAGFIVSRAASLGINNTVAYNTYAKSQLDYILGSSGHSFVVGFGKDPPLRPYHKAASCKSAPAVCDWQDQTKDSPNPHVLFGAVVGGPDEHDHYEDIRTKIDHNSVALDFNACYSGLLAAVIETL